MSELEAIERMNGTGLAILMSNSHDTLVKIVSVDEYGQALVQLNPNKSRLNTVNLCKLR